MAQRVLEAIEQAGTNFVESVAQLLPRAVVTLSIIVVGLFIAIMLKWLTRWVLGRLGFNTVCERFELAALLKAAGLPSAEALASAAVFWIVWIGFLLSGVDVLGFAVRSSTSGWISRPEPVLATTPRRTAAASRSAIRASWSSPAASRHGTPRPG